MLYLLLILFLIPLSVYRLSSSQNKEQPRKIILAAVATPSQAPTQIPKAQPDQLVAKYLANQDGRFAVVVKNLKTGESFSYNSKDKYDSASLYKLWVMAVAFQKIKDGTLDENETLSASTKNLDDILSTTIPTPTPRDFTPIKESKKINMKVKEAMGKMITVSDNYAAFLLVSRLGSSSISTFLKDYGFESSNFNQPPQTSADDIALFFEKLYKGEIIDQDYSEKMLNLLKQQTLNDRLPKYLPWETYIAHKTGELFESKHDGGIVYTPKGDYILVVLSETSNSASAAHNIAEFSKQVYDYVTVY